MSEKKPAPAVVKVCGKECPVCGKRTYSAGGIHPQCAVQQADSARSEKLKAERKREAAKSKPANWRNKTCPKCKRESHVRLRVCPCGHEFFE